jgi:hypothetical protein
MVKLKFVSEPTFTFDVPVPVAGKDPVPVNMTFKYRRKTELAEWMASRAGKSDTESFMEMVTAWELEDPFTKESVTEFLEIYGGASIATFRVYLSELVGAREKNSAR